MAAVTQEPSGVTLRHGPILLSGLVRRLLSSSQHPPIDRRDVSMISAHATPKTTNPLAILEAAVGSGTTATGAVATSSPASFLTLLMQLVPGTILSKNGNSSAESQDPGADTLTGAKKKKTRIRLRRLRPRC